MQNLVLKWQEHLCNSHINILVYMAQSECTEVLTSASSGFWAVVFKMLENWQVIPVTDTVREFTFCWALILTGFPKLSEGQSQQNHIRAYWTHHSISPNCLWRPDQFRKLRCCRSINMFSFVNTPIKLDGKMANLLTIFNLPTKVYDQSVRALDLTARLNGLG